MSHPGVKTLIAAISGHVQISKCMRKLVVVCTGE